jgi:hypothetical protein
VEEMEILGKMLGGIPRVKVMRLFLLNPEQAFDIDDVTDRCRLQKPVARQAINALVGMTLTRKKSFVKEVLVRNKSKKKRVAGWNLNTEFPYIDELKRLLVEGEFFKHTELAKRFKPAGKIQLLVVSGIFIQNSESRLDVLIVGDNLKRGFIQKTIQVLESELGKELAYAVFDTPDFKYRISMYDKLLRDVFDYPHERLVAGKEFSTFTLPN